MCKLVAELRKVFGTSSLIEGFITEVQTEKCVAASERTAGVITMKISSTEYLRRGASAVLGISKVRWRCTLGSWPWIKIRDE